MLKLLPRLVLVPATHEGAAFVFGRNVRRWGAGLHWYWPVATQYKMIAVVRQTQLIQSKVVMTRHHQTVIVGALLANYVDDGVTALAKVADLASDVMEGSHGTIYETINTYTLEEIQSDRTAFKDVLTQRASDAMNGYGIQIIQVQLTELAPTRPRSINLHGAVRQYSLWTGF